MCPPFVDDDDNHDDDDDDNHDDDDDDDPICTQFIERSLDGRQQGGGVKVVQENLQSDLQLVPESDHGDLGDVDHNHDDDNDNDDDDDALKSSK